MNETDKRLFCELVTAAIAFGRRCVEQRDPETLKTYQAAIDAGAFFSCQVATAGNRPARVSVLLVDEQAGTSIPIAIAEEEQLTLQ